MNITLVKLSYDNKDLLGPMLDEWQADIVANKTNHSPWAIFRNDYHDFEYYLKNIETDVESNGLVPDSTFFCLDTDRNIFVGAVNIRHYLAEGNYLTGGHIGDGIRPSERHKGYGTAMVGLALEECRKLGLNKVLMTCNKNNIASAKTIINNGGVLEDEIYEDGELEQRYWINLFDEIIESKRLVLRRVMPMDYEKMAAWTMDERVYRFLPGNPLTDPKKAMEWLRRDDPNSTTQYVLLFESIEDGRTIGIISTTYNKERNVWELAYSTRYDEWGKGYTTEAAKALMNYVRKLNGPCVFEAECAEDNKGSRGVMKKLGMTFERYSSYSKKDGGATFKSEIYRLS